MKNWSNKKHEERLKQSKLRKMYKQNKYILEDLSTMPSYMNLYKNTDTFTEFESNKNVTTAQI